MAINDELLNLFWRSLVDRDSEPQSGIEQAEVVYDEAAFLRHGQVVAVRAPAKGMTSGYGAGLDNQLVSIHAPAKGATSQALRLGQSMECFNPRTREGATAVF